MEQEKDLTIEEGIALMLPCPFCGDGWKIFEHSHPDYETIYTTQGRTLPCFCTRGTLNTLSVREAVAEVNRRA